MVFLFGKVEKTFRYSKVLFKKEEIYKTKVVVLRENIFQCVQVNSLVKGDIVRLKRGEKVPHIKNINREKFLQKIQDGLL